VPLRRQLTGHEAGTEKASIAKATTEKLGALACSNEDPTTANLMGGSKKQLIVYQDITIKKNPSSTSELLASCVKSQNNTHRMMQEAIEPKEPTKHNQQNDKDLEKDGLTSKQEKKNESRLKSNLIKKMQMDGMIVSESNRRVEAK
jgi:hypothetical protein